MKTIIAIPNIVPSFKMVIYRSTVVSRFSNIGKSNFVSQGRINFYLNMMENIYSFETEKLHQIIYVLKNYLIS